MATVVLVTDPVCLSGLTQSLWMRSGLKGRVQRQNVVCEMYLGFNMPMLTEFSVSGVKGQRVLVYVERLNESQLKQIKWVG